MNDTMASDILEQRHEIFENIAQWQNDTMAWNILEYSTVVE